MTEGDFSITNKTRMNKGKLTGLPFKVLKDDILGKSYSLSIAFVSEKQSQAINKAHRGKDKSTNILSFAFSKADGEILLCPAVITKEAPDFDKNFTQFLLFLVIHGMLHLKGMTHSSKMERRENLYYQKYDQKYFNRHRRGHIDDKSSRRGIFEGESKRRANS